MNFLNQFISAFDALTSSGRYMERLHSRECTEEVRENAAELAKRTSALYKDFFKHCVSSGFRTIEANTQAGGAKSSSHKKGMALDIFHIGYWLLADWNKNGENSFLAKHDLYMEHPDYTKSWHHFQTFPPPSKKRVFIP